MSLRHRFRDLANSVGLDGVKLVVNEQAALQGRTHARGREVERAFACTDGQTVWVRPKILGAAKDTVDGILMHELAHCWLIQHGHAEHTEKECDEAAEHLFGLPIHYDDRDVQTVGPGGPRPEYLPNPRPKRGQELSIMLDGEGSTGIVWATLSPAEANGLLQEHNFLDEDEEDFFTGRKNLIFVMDLRVDEEHRGQGQGTQLLLEAIEDVPEVWLIAFNEHRSPVPFYLKHGFEVIQRNRHDQALMRRRV
jgi:GNAT superfamily N-acetyltransferase